MQLLTHALSQCTANADCATLAEPQGGYIAGVYELHPAQSNPFDAYCDGAWTVIQVTVTTKYITMTS